MRIEKKEKKKPCFVSFLSKKTKKRKIIRKNNNKRIRNKKKEKEEGEKKEKEKRKVKEEKKKREKRKSSVSLSVEHEHNCGLANKTPQSLRTLILIATAYQPNQSSPGT